MVLYLVHKFFDAGLLQISLSFVFLHLPKDGFFLEMLTIHGVKSATNSTPTQRAAILRQISRSASRIRASATYNDIFLALRSVSPRRSLSFRRRRIVSSGIVERSLPVFHHGLLPRNRCQRRLAIGDSRRHEPFIKVSDW